MTERTLDPDPLRGLVLADGTPPTRAGLDSAWPGWDTAIAFVVAADGGARLARQLDLTIDRWIGDGDSLAPSELETLREAGVPTDLVRQDKDESDTELAVLAAAEVAGDISILGALGGLRVDHAIANLGLLAHPDLAGRTIRLLDDRSRVTLIQSLDAERGRRIRAELDGRVGDLVSLLPMGDAVEGVTTDGLRYPLNDDRLVVGPARGLSNVRLSRRARVSIRTGRLLVVETPATLSQ
jgi:thiamine pyrophosphokinase